MTSPELEVLWRRLQAPATDGETIACATGVSAEGSDVVIGLDHLGRPHLMIPLGANRLVISKRSAGVSVHAPRPLLHEGVRRNYLDISCTKPVLRPVFARLAAELVTEAAREPAGAAQRCATLIDSWRALFGSLGGTFGRMQAVGLLGELLVLRELARDSREALLAWTGPLGGVHDFRRGTLALEVKTTLGREGRFHTISGIDQLQPPAAGRLDFISIRLEPVPGGPVSIAGVLRELASAGVDPGELDRRIAETGLKEGSPPEFAEETFEVRDMAVFPVDADFPRLTPASFVNRTPPLGIIAIRYDIDLSSEPPRRMDPAAAQACLRNFALGHGA